MHACAGATLLHLSVSRGRNRSASERPGVFPPPPDRRESEDAPLTRASWPGPPNLHPSLPGRCCHENMLLIRPRVRDWTHDPRGGRDPNTDAASARRPRRWRTPRCGTSGMTGRLSVPSVTYQGALRLQIRD